MQIDGGNLLDQYASLIFSFVYVADLSSPYMKCDNDGLVVPPLPSPDERCA